MSRKIRLTRRQLLAGTSRLAVLSWAAPLVAGGPAQGQQEQEPWFDDGTGWID